MSEIFVLTSPRTGRYIGIYSSVKKAMSGAYTDLCGTIYQDRLNELYNMQIRDQQIEHVVWRNVFRQDWIGFLESFYQRGALTDKNGQLFLISYTYVDKDLYGEIARNKLTQQSFPPIDELFEVIQND